MAVRELEATTRWSQRWAVPSSSHPDKDYTVACENGTWACSCVGWTRHFPRKDCTHIRQVKSKEPPDYTRMPKRAEVVVEHGVAVAKPKPPSDAPYFVIQTKRRILLDD